MDLDGVTVVAPGPTLGPMGPRTDAGLPFHRGAEESVSNGHGGHGHLSQGSPLHASCGGTGLLSSKTPKHAYCEAIPHTGTVRHRKTGTSVKDTPHIGPRLTLKPLAGFDDYSRITTDEPVLSAIRCNALLSFG